MNVLFTVRRLPLEKLANANFWLDIGRARNEIVFYYHMVNTSVAKSSHLEGLTEFTGDLNAVMNKAVLSMCKEFPLSLLAYTKNFMTAGGAGDLFNLKPRIIRCMSEHIIRYVMTLC